MMQENGMMLEVLPLEAGGARLVRVYGQDPCVVLPGSVPAPAGGSWPITELGDYCFSEKPRSLPASDAVCRYQVDDTGAVRLTRAFGQVVGGSARRYDFDFDAPAADPDDLHPVCGSFVEEVTLPDRLQVIGSCAFYNCRKLRLLTVGAEGLTLGSDVFLNCFALETIRVQAEADAATGLFALVNNITEAVRAEFRPAGAAAPLAALWYPAYWEDIEETPAHILLHTFSGQGYHYRQCFLNNKFLPAEYDAIFPQGHDADDANIMAMLCFDRLRWPWQLSETAAGHYRAFLSANTGRVLARLLKAQDTDSIRALLALDVLDKAAFAEGAALAAKAENAAAAALLADAEHKKFAAAKPKCWPWCAAGCIWTSAFWIWPSRPSRLPRMSAAGCWPPTVRCCTTSPPGCCSFTSRTRSISTGCICMWYSTVYSAICGSKTAGSRSCGAWPVTSRWKT